MDRRRFSGGLMLSGAATLVGTTAHSQLTMSDSSLRGLDGLGEGAFHTCYGQRLEGVYCDARISKNDFVVVQSIQKTVVWCWAATLEMIFRWHRKQISQESICAQVYGQVTAVPASIPVLIKSVGRTYVDAAGNKFDVRSRIFSAHAGVVQLHDGHIIHSLAQGRPLIICTASHMMPLIGVQYIFNPQTRIPKIRQAWVADPFPTGHQTMGMGPLELNPGMRYLRADEMNPPPMGQMTFLADIKVS